MKTLSDRSCRVLREIARTLFDTGRGVPEARLDWTIAELRALLGRAGLLAVLGVRLAVALLQLAPLFVLGLPRRLTGLAPSARARILSAIEHGPFSMLLVPVKLYLCLVYFEHPDVNREIGIDGKPLLAGEAR